MIIFDPSGNKMTILIVLTVFSTAIIAWQWVASDPFSGVANNSNFLIKIQEESNSTFNNIKNSTGRSLEEAKELKDELDKQAKQDQLLEETQKYLKNKNDLVIERPKNQEDCEANNGQWGLWGVYPEKVCNLFTDDVGQECNDGRECQGACISDLDNIDELLAEGQPVETSGFCSKYVNVFGCFAFVEEGFVEAEFCID